MQEDKCVCSLPFDSSQVIHGEMPVIDWLSPMKVKKRGVKTLKIKKPERKMGTKRKGSCSQVLTLGGGAEVSSMALVDL